MKDLPNKVIVMEDELVDDLDKKMPVKETVLKPVTTQNLTQETPLDPPTLSIPCLAAPPARLLVCCSACLPVPCLVAPL